MRLWHVDLLPYIPDLQLVAQWRELNSVFKKQDKHILINYIYDYPKDYLLYYTALVISEMKRRNLKIKKWDNFKEYFGDMYAQDGEFDEHNDEYLIMNFFNLKEKYIRGQKDFTPAVYERLHKFIYERFNGTIKL